MELPALTVQQPDFGKALATAQAIKGGQIQNRLLDYKLNREKQLGDIRSKLFNSDSGAATADGGVSDSATSGTSSLNSDLMKRYLAVDPQGGAQIIGALDKMDAAQRKKAEDKARISAGLAYQVQSAPPEQRPMLYAQALATGERLGLDISRLPRQYDPQAVQQLLMQTAAMADYAKIKASTKEPVVKVMTAKGPKYVKQSEAAGQAAYDSPLVKINNTQETERSKAYGKSVGEYYGKQFTGLQSAATSARSQNATLDRIDQLLDQTATGKYQGGVVEMKKALETIGLKSWADELPGNAPPAEAATALSNRIALELRNPAGGAGMPGSMSDRDREFLQGMVPGIGQTKEGRKLLIDGLKKVNQRSVEVARMARDYQKKHGQLDAGFEDELQKWSDAHPLFDQADMGMREKARLPEVSDQTAYDSLPSGSYYRGPDGQVRQKR